MAVKNSNWQYIQQYIWLIGGLLFLFMAIIFWMMTDTRALVKENKQIEETQVVIQSEKVAASTHLGGLTEEVRPLESVVRKVTVGNHLAEFRGTKFIQDNQKNWVIELFRATNEDVIKSFLRRQNDTRNLIYFRLSGENHAEQYVLALGPFKSENEAKTQLDLKQFALPPSVKPTLAKLEKYSSLVNDLGSDELVSNTTMYAVQLKSAPLPVIDETVLARQRAAMNEALRTTTKTTVTRKDQTGKVVDVQRSQSAVEPSKPRDSNAGDQQISDPFN